MTISTENVHTYLFNIVFSVQKEKNKRNNKNAYNSETGFRFMTVETSCKQ